MRGVVDRGTGTAARLSVPAAGKTGTTQRNNDAWFVGYLPNGMTAAVWMGYDPVDTDGDGKPDEAHYMSSVHGRAVTGGSFPAEMWHDFMTRWLDETGASVGRFPSVDRFPGRILGSDLSITTSTLPACGPAGAGASSTTGACLATSTSSSSSTSTSGSSTTSTTARGATTTAAPTTSTTAPPASTTSTTARPAGTTTSTTR
jgi:penicillin-binding protein 1A